jgi:sortase A
MRRLATLVSAVAIVVGTACSHDQAASSATSLLVVTTTSQPPAPTTTTTAATAATTVPPPPSTSDTPSAPSTPAPTTAPAVVLPVPEPPPPEDGTTEATSEVGFIEIPRTGLRTPMFEGIRLSTLNLGPGHWPGSAMPGNAGNVVVAGHRTSHNAEFRHLDDLVPGDEVIMSTPDGRFVYRVRSTEVVGPDALWIVDQTTTPTATLFACHPPGSVSERIVVHMELSA